MYNNKRKNKYPNNIFTKTDIQRSKKITPHERKEVTKKANRNGFVLETIPAHKPLEHSTFVKRTESRNFFKDLYSKDGYYHYLFIPIIVLLATILLDFGLQSFIYNSYNPTQLTILKENIFFLIFSIIIFSINVASIVFMGLALSKHNIKFGVAWYRVFRIVALIFIIESALTVVAYITFLSPHISTWFASETLRRMYLIYLVAWNLIKAVVYMIILSLSYIFFFRFKFV